MLFHEVDELAPGVPEGGSEGGPAPLGRAAFGDPSGKSGCRGPGGSP